MDNGFKQVIREEVEKARTEARAKLCKELLAKHRDKLPPEVAADLLAIANGERLQPEDDAHAVTPS